SALVSYRLAVATAVAGAISPRHAVLSFFWAVLGGVAFGLAAGWFLVWLRRRLHHPPVEITVSLLTPFLAYLPGEALGVSGVLAVTAAGLYVGRHGLDAFAAETRIRGLAFWDILAFLLNGLAFILIGLELRDVRERLADLSLAGLVGATALVSAVV